MTTPYQMFYGGTSGGGGADNTFKFLLPGGVNSLRTIIFNTFGFAESSDQEGSVGFKVLRFVISLVILLLFLWLLSNVRFITDKLIKVYRKVMDKTKLRGFEGMGAAVPGLNKQTHLGSLDGLKYSQHKAMSDRFSAGSEAPVFWNAPSYVLRKDELLNNAMSDYGREKASGATTMSFADWMSLNSSRYATFGESANKLASLGKGIARQNLDREGVRREGMTPSLANRTLSTAPMMGLY